MIEMALMLRRRSDLASSRKTPHIAKICIYTVYICTYYMLHTFASITGNCSADGSICRGFLTAGLSSLRPNYPCWCCNIAKQACLCHNMLPLCFCVAIYWFVAGDLSRRPRAQIRSRAFIPYFGAETFCNSLKISMVTMLYASTLKL